MITDMGLIGDAASTRGPGSKLRGQTLSLGPGDGIKFKVKQNQINNLGSITATPNGAVAVQDNVLERFDIHKPLGHAYLHEFTLMVRAGPGQTITVNTSGAPMSHNPEWQFRFTIRVVLRR